MQGSDIESEPRMSVRRAICMADGPTDGASGDVDKLHGITYNCVHVFLRVVQGARCQLTSNNVVEGTILCYDDSYM